MWGFKKHLIVLLSQKVFDPSIVDMSDMAGVPQETDTAFGAETTSSGADEGMPDLAGSDDIYGSNDLDGTS